MNRILISIALGALLAVLPPVASSQGGSHENAPGTVLHDAGNRAYEDGMYREALQMFKASARWADKLSQFNLGVMHYKGQGTTTDPATAWAWFELAAERGYPQMVETADSLWADLDDDERVKAEAILAELLPVYGDEVAVERTARYMEREKRKMTGSRTGFIGALVVHTRDGKHHDGESFYAEERWDYRRLIELEARIFDELARGRVEVGEMDVIEETDR